ncbi:MAG: c-type cytochrome [Mangrovicoccus sp.]
MGGFWRILLALALCQALSPGLVWAEGAAKLVRLAAPEALVETGLLAHILPRFSLKTQIRVELSPKEVADLSLGATGQPVFEEAGQIWHLQILTQDHAASQRFADWLGSEVGQRTVTGFAPEGRALFALPQLEVAELAPDLSQGDIAAGLRLSQTKCARCHVVEDTNRWSGIGSTPSFAVLRALPDWQARFSGFFVLNPHPSFTIIHEVTEAFAEHLPPSIVPIEMTLDELEAMLAYVTAMAPADLGQPLAHQ